MKKRTTDKKYPDKIFSDERIDPLPAQVQKSPQREWEQVIPFFFYPPEGFLGVVTGSKAGQAVSPQASHRGRGRARTVGRCLQAEKRAERGNALALQGCAFAAPASGPARRLQALRTAAPLASPAYPGRAESGCRFQTHMCARASCRSGPAKCAVPHAHRAKSSGAKRPSDWFSRDFYVHNGTGRQ